MTTQVWAWCHDCAQRRPHLLRTTFAPRRWRDRFTRRFDPDVRYRTSCEECGRLVSVGAAAAEQLLAGSRDESTRTRLRRRWERRGSGTAERRRTG